MASRGGSIKPRSTGNFSVVSMDRTRPPSRPSIRSSVVSQVLNLGSRKIHYRHFKKREETIAIYQVFDHILFTVVYVVFISLPVFHLWIHSFYLVSPEQHVFPFLPTVTMLASDCLMLFWISYILKLLIILYLDEYILQKIP